MCLNGDKAKGGVECVTASGVWVRVDWRSCRAFRHGLYLCDAARGDLQQSQNKTSISSIAAVLLDAVRSNTGLLNSEADSRNWC